MGSGSIIDSTAPPGYDTVIPPPEYDTDDFSRVDEVSIVSVNEASIVSVDETSEDRAPVIVLCTISDKEVYVPLCLVKVGYVIRFLFLYILVDLAFFCGFIVFIGGRELYNDKGKEAGQVHYILIALAIIFLSCLLLALLEHNMSDDHMDRARDIMHNPLYRWFIYVLIYAATSASMACGVFTQLYILQYETVYFWSIQSLGIGILTVLFIIGAGIIIISCTMCIYYSVGKIYINSCYIDSCTRPVYQQPDVYKICFCV